MGTFDKRQPSKHNSTKTPLLAGETFTGGTDRTDFDELEVFIISSTLCTLHVDLSVNGIDWYPTSVTGYRVQANQRITIRANIPTEYYRVRLINQGLGQSDLLMLSTAGDFPPENLSDAEYMIRLNNGLVPDRVPFTSVSYAPNLSNIEQDVWGSDSVFSLPTTNESYEVVSTSANDTVLGTGARSVYVESLGADGLIQSQVVQLNGTTPVQLTGLHSFPRMMYVIDSSLTSRANLGQLTLRVSGGGAIRSVMRPMESMSHDSIYRVPADREFHITDLDYHTGSTNKKVTVNSKVLPAGGNTWLTTSVLPFSRQSFTRDFKNASAVYPPNTTIKYSAYLDVSGGDDLALILAGNERILF